MKLLVIEDDKVTAFTIRDGLSKHFLVDIALSAKESEKKMQNEIYDVIVIDMILSDANGIDICRKIRKEGLSTPILMLTGQSEIRRKVQALDSGADDYLIKPFAMEELIARINALSRRSLSTLPSNILSVGDLTLDLSTKVVKRNNKVIPIRKKELYILEYLMRNKGQVVTREMILDHVWDSDVEAATNFIDVHIRNLREKIDKPFHKKLIKTAHGFGYKLATR